MSQALVYYYFNDFGSTAYDDLKNPVVLSIASFRKFDKATPVYVIDVSDQKQEWLHFPKKLGFELFRQNHALKHCENVVHIPENTPLSLPRLAKPLDVFELSLYCNQEVIMVCGADVLFMKSPFPLRCDFSKSFCSGSGLCYFEKSSLNTHKIFETWGSLCLAAAINPLMQTRIIESTRRGPRERPRLAHLLNENTCWKYLQHKYTYAIEELSVYDNFPVFHTGNTVYDLSQIRCLHLSHNQHNSNVPREKRARFVLHFEELKETIMEVLNEEDIKLIFKEFECDSFPLKHLVKIRDLLRRLPE